MIGVVSQLIRPANDQLLVKVHMDEMDSFVFALATKKTAARLTKEMTDIVSIFVWSPVTDCFMLWEKPK